MGTEITYIDAIREAQAHALRDDPRVFIYGQDVGAFGGAFKATKNLAKEFPGRVLDSPISEDAMVGLAVGAAIEGLRPIIEMQFADFSTVGFNQIVNQAATLFWRTNVPCPITVRLPFGGTSGGGPFHSQCIETIYAHYPGLIVLTPATVEDAYSMLLEAVALDDPVIFCEHKFLYRHLKAEKLPSEALPIGKARIAREGRDLTIVTYSAMVHEALEAATELSAEGWEIEIVDLRSVKPLDTDTVMASVARTGKLLCVGEAWPWGGVTAEIIARVASEGYGLLDAPPQRLNAKDTPVPYHPNLWTAHRPTARAVAAAARKLLRNDVQNRQSPSKSKMPAIPIIMPQLGESIAEAKIINFVVKPGDNVEADQDLIEVETDKATMTVASPCKGKIEKFTAQLNESYAVGATLGQIEATKEEAARLGLDVAPAKTSETEQLSKSDSNRRSGSRAADRARIARSSECGGRELSFAAAQGAHGRTWFARRRSCRASRAAARRDA